MLNSRLSCDNMLRRYVSAHNYDKLLSLLKKPEVTIGLCAGVGGFHGMMTATEPDEVPITTTIGVGGGAIVGLLYPFSLIVLVPSLIAIKTRQAVLRR